VNFTGSKRRDISQGKAIDHLFSLRYITYITRAKLLWAVQVNAYPLTDLVQKVAVVALEHNAFSLRCLHGRRVRRALHCASFLCRFFLAPSARARVRTGPEHDRPSLKLSCSAK